jgi:hypothetical protein
MHHPKVGVGTSILLVAYLPFVFNTRPPEMRPLQRDNNRNKRNKKHSVQMINKRNNNRSVQMNNKRNNNHDKGTTVVILGQNNVVLIELYYLPNYLICQPGVRKLTKHMQSICKIEAGII